MLAVDTTNQTCKIACKFAEKTAELASQNDQKNTDVVLHLVLQACLIVNMKVSDIKEIIVTTGPGSFTGTRVGVLIAQMLSYANNAKIYPISSSLAIAYSAYKQYGNGSYAIIQDARMQEYYFAVINIINGDARVLMQDHKCTDPKASKYDFIIETAAIDPIQMLELINKTEPSDNIKPLYLKDPV